MSMTFSFKLNPFGDHNNQVLFGIIRVHSAGDSHGYGVEIKTKGGWKTVAQGDVLKNMPDGTRRSGHRNFLHLLRDILNDMDLDELGTNYVSVIKDVKEMFPNLSKTSDYPAE